MSTNEKSPVQPTLLELNDDDYNDCYGVPVDESLNQQIVQVLKLFSAYFH
jgi:hypothetical protein